MKGQTNALVLKNRIQRTLRRNMTDAEKVLWQRLRGGQIGCHKFRRQHPYGDYILDFVCFEAQLVIEVDGSQHCGSTRDVQRDQFLEAAGFRIVRFWNNQVMTELDAVVEVVWQVLKTHPHPNLPPEGEGMSEEKYHAK